MLILFEKYRVYTSTNYLFDKSDVQEHYEYNGNKNSITLYSVLFDKNASYFVYHPMEEIKVSKMDELTDLVINFLFNELLKTFTLQDLLFHLSVNKLDNYYHYYPDSSSLCDKYTARYLCDCYGWICDGCLDDLNNEINDSIEYIINQRYIITVMYEVSKEDIYGSLKIIANKVFEIVDKVFKEQTIKDLKFLLLPHDIVYKIVMDML